MFNISAILSLLKIPSVLFVVVLKAVVGVPAGVFHAMFTMVNLERFDLTPESNGKLLSYVGVLTMVTELCMTPYSHPKIMLACFPQPTLLTHPHTQLMQGFGVGFFSRKFPDHFSMRISIVVMTISYLMLVSLIIL